MNPFKILQKKFNIRREEIPFYLQISKNLLQHPYHKFIKKDLLVPLSKGRPRKKIMFIKEQAGVRLWKQVKALKSTGRYFLILVTHFYAPCEYQGIFEDIILYRNRRHLIKIVRNFKGYLIHAYGWPSAIVKLAIEEAKVPVVYDLYDSKVVTYGKENLPFRFRNEFETEKFCFENADGIITKSPEIEYLKKFFKIKAPTILFQDYCLDELIVNRRTRKISQKDGEFHLVYVGQVSPMSYPKKIAGGTQFLDIARILASQRIHFHIYSSPFHRRSYPKYRRFMKATQYFHLHKPMSIRKLPKEIARYDYGLYLVDYRNAPAVTDEKQKTGTGNKFASYLEATLPIIVNSDLEYESKRVKRTGIGLVIDMKNIPMIRSILQSMDYERLIKKIETTRETFNMAKKIIRLETFYRKAILHNKIAWGTHETN